MVTFFAQRCRQALSAQLLKLSTLLIAGCLQIATVPGQAQPIVTNPYNPIIGGHPVYCTSSTGHPVAFIADPNLTDIGMASPGLPPTIRLNTTLLSRLPDKLQLFWYGHECGHHVMGHSIGTYTHASERDADCWAIQVDRQQRLFSRADVESFEPYFRNNPGSPWGHLPGPERMRNFLRCYDQAREPSDTTTLDQCISAMPEQCRHVCR